MPLEPLVRALAVTDDARLAYPGARIYELSEHGIAAVEFEDTDHVRLVRAFLADRERFFRQLLD